MDNSNKRLEQITMDSDVNNHQCIYSNSSDKPITSLLEEGLLRFRLSDENIRQTITKNAFIVLNNVWKSLASGL